MPPQIFPRNSYILGFTLWQEDFSPTPWNIYNKFIYTVLSCIELFKFHKRRNFFSLYKKLSAIWANLTLYHSSLFLPKKTFLFPSVWSISEHTWTVIWKKTFGFVLASYPLRQSKKRMMSTLLIMSRFI